MAETQAPVLAHPDPNPAWLARLTEDVLEPELPIIDPHHHLWDRSGNRYFLDDLLADTGSGHNVVATVFLQCGAFYRTDGPEELRPLGETEYVAGVAAESERRRTKTHACAGIVGHVDFRLGERVDSLLEAHIAAAGGRFRGIRHATARDAAFLSSVLAPPPFGLMADPNFRTGFSRLAKFGLSFDAWLYHTQISELTDLARAYPAIPIVLDHVGGPLGTGPYRGKRDEVFAVWLPAIKELATCPNVHMKLGGLAMAVNGYDFQNEVLPPSSGELANEWRMWMEPCIEAFGPQRCMFESNFPVDKAMCSYPVLWNAFKRIAGGASAGEKASLFHDTAAKFYRLSGRAMNGITRRATLGGLATAALARPALIRAQTLSAPVRIGLLSDVGGPYRDVGGPGSKLAAEMAAADFGGSVLGRPIEVLQADDQNKADVAGAIAREWIDDKGVDVLADGAASSAGLAIQQITREKKRIFLMSTPTSTVFIGKQCSPYGFQFSCDTYALAKGTGGELARNGGDTWFFITADYEFGTSLQASTEQFVKEAGGKVLGSARAPLGTADFSSFLVQAKASGARVIGLANAGTDLQNCIKQAAEFGIVKGGQRLATLLMIVQDVISVGQDVCQGLVLTNSFYWDLSPETRAWTQRYVANMAMPPNEYNAAAYAAVSHWLKSAKAANTLDADAVAAKMRELPLDDFYNKNVRIQANGCVPHTMYTWEVKPTSAATHKWDIFKPVGNLPTPTAYPPPGLFGCPLVPS